MAELLKTEGEEWVEISDGEGHTAAMRHLAAVRVGEKLYHVLGAVAPADGRQEEGGLLLVREDDTADGAKEYVVTSDEQEIASVVGSFVMKAVELAALDEDEPGGEDEEDGVCACGECHAPGEFCFCDDPELLQ